MKLSELNEQADRMKLGLEKLHEAALSVKQLSIELVDKEKELEVANVKAEEILIEVFENNMKYILNSVVSTPTVCSMSQCKNFQLFFLV